MTHYHSHSHNDTVVASVDSFRLCLRPYTGEYCNVTWGKYLGRIHHIFQLIYMIAVFIPAFITLIQTKRLLVHRGLTLTPHSLQHAIYTLLNIAIITLLIRSIDPLSLYDRVPRVIYQLSKDICSACLYSVVFCVVNHWITLKKSFDGPTHEHAHRMNKRKRIILIVFFSVTTVLSCLEAHALPSHAFSAFKLLLFALFHLTVIVMGWRVAIQMWYVVHHHNAQLTPHQLPAAHELPRRIQYSMSDADENSLLRYVKGELLLLPQSRSHDYYSVEQRQSEPRHSEVHNEQPSHILAKHEHFSHHSSQIHIQTHDSNQSPPIIQPLHDSVGTALRPANISYVFGQDPASLHRHHASISLHHPPPLLRHASLTQSQLNIGRVLTEKSVEEKVVQQQMEDQSPIIVEDEIQSVTATPLTPSRQHKKNQLLFVLRLMTVITIGSIVLAALQIHRAHQDIAQRWNWSELTRPPSKSVFTLLLMAKFEFAQCLTLLLTLILFRKFSVNQTVKQPMTPQPEFHRPMTQLHLEHSNRVHPLLITLPNSFQTESVFVSMPSHSSHPNPILHRLLPSSYMTAAPSDTAINQSFKTHNNNRISQQPSSALFNPQYINTQTYTSIYPQLIPQ